MANESEVTKHGLLDMQVCVPEQWADEQVIDFAEAQFPCGTTYGWSIRRQGDDKLAGYDERVACAEREGCVHIMLDA